MPPTKNNISLLNLLDASRIFLEDNLESYANQLGNFFPMQYHISLAPTPTVCEKHDAPIILIQQFYVDSNKSRHKENTFCLQKNVDNTLIDKIILLNEREYSTTELGVDSSKISQVIIDKRLTYSKAFEYCSNVKNSYVILANLDIFFDESLQEMKSVGLHKTKSVFCQLRHEYSAHKPLSKARLFGPRPDSQDAWIWHTNNTLGSGKFKRLTDFKLGMPGCDNKIVYLLFLMGNTCYNDPNKIKIYHHHASQERSYTHKDMIKPPYIALHHTIDNSKAANSTFNTLLDNNNLFNYISTKIKKNEHFIIPRIAKIENIIAMEGYHLQFIERSAEAKKTIDKATHLMKNNAGICLSDLGSAENYSREYLRAFGVCDCFCGWEPWSHVTSSFNGYHGISQEFVIEKYKKQMIDAKVLDVHNFMYATPWTHALRGKRILIISPHVDIISKQISSKNKIYNTSVFLDNSFVFLKPPQTQKDNNFVLFREAHQLFVENIKNIKDSFDIALLCCGGYGNPICATLHMMGKSAIYVGNVLQMYFGIYKTKQLQETPDIMRLHMNLNWVKI